MGRLSPAGRIEGTHKARAGENKATCRKPTLTVFHEILKIAEMKRAASWESGPFVINCKRRGLLAFLFLGGFHPFGFSAGADGFGVVVHVGVGGVHSSFKVRY